MLVSESNLLWHELRIIQRKQWTKQIQTKINELQLKMTPVFSFNLHTNTTLPNCPLTHPHQWEDLQTTGISRSQIKARNVKTEKGTAHYHDTAISHVDIREKGDTTGGSGSCR